MFLKEQSKSIPSMWLITDSSQKVPDSNRSVVLAWTHNEGVADKIIQGLAIVEATQNTTPKRTPSNKED